MAIDYGCAGIHSAYFRSLLFTNMIELKRKIYYLDKISYVSRNSIDDVIKSIEVDSIKFFKRIVDNQMKATKYHITLNKLYEFENREYKC